MRARLLPTVAAAVLAVALQACAGLPGSTASPSPSPTATVADEDVVAVNTALEEVAASRSALERDVAAATDAVARIDPMVAGLRSAERVDATLDGVPGVAAAVAAVDVAALQAEVDRLGTALDEAGTALDAVAPQLEPGSWRARYVAAQREVLLALRTWQQRQAALVDALAAGWPLWQRTVDAAAVLDEERFLYRTPEEAAGTWEVEIGGDLTALADASASLPPLVDAAEQAAGVVTLADQRAAEVFLDRPVADATADPAGP